ncbi:MAG: helix-turn-helix domain-containing protein [Acidobacteriota bacterium]
MRKAPPKKRPGQGKGPRTLNGEVMDKAAVADFLGCSKKTVDARIDRGLLPHRKWGGRTIVLRSELIQFMQRLEGTSVDEAVKNQRARGNGGDEQEVQS